MPCFYLTPKQDDFNNCCMRFNQPHVQARIYHSFAALLGIGGVLLILQAASFFHSHRQHPPALACRLIVYSIKPNFDPRLKFLNAYFYPLF